ncbi:chondroitin sulfate synthase 2-like [Portunus trituberculatus]|uniref:chondroitin sulfate synthase 2-like n=1 Tax=Portunus trituberculatus TaxID=210409 RepID=UPI001E1D11A3|nr:chondroitin sulfate synthase 2-like [Portunus trituberculatus]
MSFGVRSLLVHGRQSTSLIIGLCVGISLSLILTPYLEEDCSGGLSHELLGGVRVGNLRDLRSSGPAEEEDYEPRIILKSYSKEELAKPEKPEKLLRPRYYATELGIREKLLVAVVSSKETASSFGVSINRTLSHYVDKLIFFIDGFGTKKMGLNIPIVGFKDEKPLIKVFRILSYLNENYLNEYDYFFLVSDRTYVHGRQLVRMVQRLSISRAVHMGHLLDHPGALYCSLDAGIVLSHSVLRRVAGQLSWCTRNTYSDSDTDNLGRCILHAVDQPCVSSLQGQHYNSYRLREDVEVVSHLQLVGGSSLVQESITVTNVPEASDMFSIHIYFLQNDLRHLNHTILEYRREIEATKPNAPAIRREETWPVGSVPPHHPATRFDVIQWDTFNATHFFLPDDFHNTKPLIGVDLLDIMSVVNASVAHMHAKAKGQLEYKELEYGHRRTDPTRGVDYILSLVFRDNTSGLRVTRKLQGSRLLTEPEIIPMPYVTENNRLTLVLPVDQSEIVEATQFVQRYEAECMVKGEHTFLMLALLYKPGVSSAGDDKDVFKSLKDLALQYTQEHHEAGSKVGWSIVHTLASLPSELAIADLVLRKMQEDTLVLVTRHSAHITTDFLNRVRMNTILNWQVFSPVPFTQYHPDTVSDTESYAKMDVNKNNGRFDAYNFDHISFYIGDFLAARRAMAESIPIIRNEKELRLDRPQEQEFGLYGLFVRGSDLHVLRAPEAGLKLGYREVGCAKRAANQSERLNGLCRLQEGQSYGLRSELSKLVLDYIEGGQKV